MRVLSVAMMIMLGAGTAAAQTVAVDHREKCARPASTKVDGVKPKSGVHKLGEEPPAKQYLTVLRTLDGCPAPIVLRTEIGSKK